MQAVLLPQHAAQPTWGRLAMSPNRQLFLQQRFPQVLLPEMRACSPPILTLRTHTALKNLLLHRALLLR
jgi:hypothetical protein